MENRSGILKWQETCLAKGQRKWGLERLLGAAESCDGGGGETPLGSRQRMPGEELGFVLE